MNKPPLTPFQKYRLARLRVAQKSRASKNDAAIIAAMNGPGTRAEQAARLGMTERGYEKARRRARIRLGEDIK